MQDIHDHIHQLYVIADAIRSKATLQAEKLPGLAFIDKMLAERTEIIADCLGKAAAKQNRDGVATA